MPHGPADVIHRIRHFEKGAAAMAHEEKGEAMIQQHSEAVAVLRRESPGDQWGGIRPAGNPSAAYHEKHCGAIGFGGFDDIIGERHAGLVAVNDIRSDGGNGGFGRAAYRGQQRGRAAGQQQGRAEMEEGWFHGSGQDGAGV